MGKKKKMIGRSMRGLNWKQLGPQEKKNTERMKKIMEKYSHK